jgi:hypothetical protein
MERLRKMSKRNSVGVSARQIILQLPLYDTAYLEAEAGRASSSRPEVDGRTQGAAHAIKITISSLSEHFNKPSTA